MQNETNPPRHRILVVDDNPSIHDDFRKILCPSESKGDNVLDSLAADLLGESAQPTNVGIAFEMDSAYQGQEALQKVKVAEAEGRPYSLAFMDVRMPPGWDGIETVMRIWQEHPAIQVVICTAYSDYSWEEILRKLGETDSLVILKKPFDNVEVLQLAHTLTKKWAVTRQAGARMADLDEMVRRRTLELLEANHKLEGEIKRRGLIEAALRDSEERFHKAFETVSVPILIFREWERQCIDANPSFVALSGYDKDEVVGKPLDDLRFFADPEQEGEIRGRLARQGKIEAAELTICRKDGQRRQTLVSIERLVLAESPCLLAAMLDVTEQRRLEEQLRQSQKMEAVGQLAAGVAHDFNNLLTVIHGYASLTLARANLDQNVTKAFTQVRQAAERASSLTRQLLAFSRKTVVQRKPVRLSATFDHMHAMLSRMLGEMVRLECVYPDTLPLIKADEPNIEQVIMNLVVNARDAMSNGGKVRLEAAPVRISATEAAADPEWREGDYVVLSVTDTGCGMDAQTLGRIFEPFFSTKPPGRGTGLGLSTVYGIVKQHEGWVAVRSKPGAGTTFRVFLPVTHESPDGEAGGEPPHSAEVALPAAKVEGAILVVEDEPEVREYVTSVLSENGYRVVQASSGVHALRVWETLPEKVRLLLTDMVMPDGVSGSLLARQLLRGQPDLKVVYTSGYSPDAIANGEILTEGLNFLTKPFSREHLLRTVQKALETDTRAVELTVSTPEREGGRETEDNRCALTP
jgi:PAS domain S-box-containing protein